MKIFTLMGADACGKDTQLEKLRKHFEGLGHKVQVITIWDSLRDFHQIEDQKTLHKIVETFLLKFEPHARSFFLLACLKNAVSKIRPDSEIIFLNGFYQKYWASEMNYGIEKTFWEKEISSFPPSDKIIYIKTPVEVCLKRKEQWSQYEQGLGISLSTSVYESKETFQKKLHQKVDQVAAMMPNCHIIDGSQSIEEVFKSILKVL